MAYSVQKRGEPQIGKETTFGAGASELKTMRLEECTIPLGREYQTGNDIKQDDSRDPGTWLNVAGDITIKGSLHPQQNVWPTGASVDSDIAPVTIPFEACLGEGKRGGYGVLAGSSTTTLLKFPTTEGADTPSEMGFVPGEMIYVRAAGANNILGCNVIKSVDDVANTITLRSPLPSAPLTGAIVYGGYSLPKQDMTTLEGYEIKHLGSAAFDVRRGLGCTIKSLKVDAPYGAKTATFDATFWAALLVPPTASETGGAPSVASYPYPEGAQVANGGIWVWDGTTNHKIEGGFSLDFGVKNSPIGGIHGTDPNGYSGAVLTGRDITLEVQPAYTGNTYLDWMDTAPAACVVTFWWGKGAQVIGGQIPAAILVDTPADGTDGEAKTLVLKFGDGSYTGDTGTFDGQDAGNKSFVMGWLAGEVTA